MCAEKTTLYFLVEVQTQQLGLWCLMPLSTIFQLYRGGQFNWWRKPEYPKKNSNTVLETHILLFFI